VKTGGLRDRPSFMPRSTVIAVLAALGVLFVFLLIIRQETAGPLVVYCAHDAQYAGEILKEFEQRSGIPVAVRYDTAPPQLTELIIREKDAPRGDVFWNNEPLGMLDLQERRLLQPYRGPGHARIPAAYKAADGSWTGFAARARVIIANTAKIGTTPPNLDSLLPGSDRSQIAIAQPLSGTTLTHYTVLWQLWGGERVKVWHREWREGGIRECHGNAAVKDLVAGGACVAGFTDTGEFFAAKDAGQPVAMHPVRAEGAQTIVIPNTVAILRGARREFEAQKLVDFLLSEETEIALARSKARQIPLGEVPERRLPAEVREMRAWVREGVDLTKLGAVRAECLAWLKTQYAP